MKLHTTLTALFAGGALASTASAQVFTELRLSTSGADQEYVEILGTPGQSTDGLMIAVVESDDNTSLGTLDFVYDLSANAFPAGDQYFVFGSVEADAAFPGEIDLIGLNGSNLFENSTATIYLLDVPDPNNRTAVSGLQGTDVRTAAGATTTVFPTMMGVTILDMVGIRDAGATDVVFDAAPEFGPDGSFFPAGIARNGGCPGDWCSDVFLNFRTDGVPNPPYFDPTPGATNPSTTCTPGTPFGPCPGGGTLGTNYCAAVANSTGATGSISATGSILAASNDVTLTGSGLPTGQFGIFVTSAVAGFVPNPAGSNGNLCLAGSLGRFVGPGQILAIDGNGEINLTIDLASIPSGGGTIAVAAGDTRFFQAWHRDGVGGGSNFTNGLEITFQ